MASPARLFLGQCSAMTNCPDSPQTPKAAEPSSRAKDRLRALVTLLAKRAARQLQMDTSQQGSKAGDRRGEGEDND